MDIILVIIGLFLKIFAVPILIIGLIWFYLAGRRLYKEKKSLDAFRGNEIALAMEKKRLKARLIWMLGIILWPVTIVALGLLLADMSGEAAAHIALVVATIVSGLCLAWSVSLKGHYNTEFKEQIVQIELAKVFDRLTYEPQGKFERDSIQSLQFFSVFDDFTGNDLIVADYKGLHFAQCDMAVKERYTVAVADNSGHSRTEERWRDVFKGRAMRFDFADKFKGRVQVVSKDFEAAQVKNFRGQWQTVETELAEFGQHFEIYAQDQLEAMANLTPQMIEGIFYLKKALDLPTAFYFTENTMFVFMAMEREAFDVSGKNTLLEEVRFLERDIALVTGFMEVMYFKRQGDSSLQPQKTGEGSRAETVASVAAAAGPSGAEKALTQAKRTVGTALSLFPKAIIAVYLISAVYGFINLPDELLAGVTYSGGEWVAPPEAPSVPTIAFLLVSGVFIVIPALMRFSIFSLICLMLYLLFMAANL